MHRCGQGIRFLSSSSNTQINWDPIVSLELNHPTIILLEKCCLRDHFKQILGQMMRTNLIGQTFSMSRLLLCSAISHPENLDMALLLFNNYTPHPNLYIFNTMINTLSFLTNQSFALYNSMLQSGIYPDKHTLLHLLQASQEVKQIHCHAVVLGLLSYGYLQNSLIKIYLENGLVGLAYQVFKHIPVLDAVSFNIMIVAYAKRGYGLEALELFLEMLVSGLEPDDFTNVGFLVYCGQLGNAKLGKSVHAWIEQRKSNGSSNLILGNALLDMYVKCKKLEFAQGIFDTLVEKEIISWNTMIAGHAKVGELDLAMIAGHDL
ncbi:pentatricopeptide repeat-containing protein [Quercus suber]|uniref:Pentatricopeptide repeat-containing protein n=1 Tax=Quercus suber TaxID=58331 RepID=A0AAW0LBN8_QUESU